MRSHLRKRRLLWVLLFVGSILLLGALATLWNTVLVQQWSRLEAIKQRVPRTTNATDINWDIPWFEIIGGSLGFVAILAVFIVFFIRLLREMRVNQQQTEFLSRISHELKTPIATLELSAGMIQEKTQTTDPKVSQLWKLHSSELARLKTEVDSLLEVSRFEHTNPDPRWQVISLDSFLQNCWPAWELLLGNLGVLTQANVWPSNFIETDVDLLRLITNNIVDNARKYGGSPPRLQVSTSITETTWEISFRDEGMGFHPDQRKQLFQKFFRLPQTAGIQGTGLGLSLVAAAVKALQLQLLAQSDGPGTGSTFTIRGKLLP